MSATSLAAVFSAAGSPLGLQQFPLPSLGPGEVLVRVSCCTLCGSDIHTFQGHRTTPSPTILGHEILGRIVALPPGEPLGDFTGEPLRLGDRVTWTIAASCNDCFYCQRGMPQKCEKLFKYGHEKISPSHPLSGGLAEHCHLARGTAIFRVPEALCDSVAAPANCATATVAAAWRVAGDCAGQSALIQGAGMLGLTAAAMAASRGAKQIIVSDVDDQRLASARRFGATHTVNVNADPEALARVVKEVTAGRGIDVAIELSGVAASMEAAIPLLRIGGRYVLVGAVSPTRPIAVSPEMIVRRWLSILGVHNYAPADLGDALRFLAENQSRFPFAELVGATYPLKDIAAAFDHAITRRPFRVAVCAD